MAVEPAGLEGWTDAELDRLADSLHLRAWGLKARLRDATPQGQAWREDANTGWLMVTALSELIEVRRARHDQEPGQERGG